MVTTASGEVLVEVVKESGVSFGLLLGCVEVVFRESTSPVISLKFTSLAAMAFNLWDGIEVHLEGAVILKVRGDYSTVHPAVLVPFMVGGYDPPTNQPISRETLP